MTINEAYKALAKQYMGQYGINCIGIGGLNGTDEIHVGSMNCEEARKVLPTEFEGFKVVLYANLEIVPFGFVADMEV